MLDISGINDIKFTSSPIHAPIHELDDTDTNIPLTKVISNRILVELLGIREESVFTLFMGYEPISFILAYFSKFRFNLLYILVYGARWLLMLDGDSLILFDVMRVVCTTCFILSR